MLDGEQRDAAARALIELGPRVALPVLRQCIAERPEGHGWQAMRVIRKLAPRDTADETSFVETASALALLAANRSLDTERRLIAILGLGSLGHRGKQAADSLVDVLYADQPPALSVAAAIALGQIGRDAAKPLGKRLTDGNILARTCCLAAIGALGKQGVSFRGEVEDMTATDVSIDAFLMCRAARETLQRLANERAAQAAWARRLKSEHGKLRQSPGGKWNPRAPFPPDPDSAAASARLRSR
jgi:HEAT repeat protein